jgi:transcription elongation GreA/GreB family factor
MQLAFNAEYNQHPAAPLLRSEVHRAIVTRDRADEVVQLNGAVRYRLDERAPVDQVLVHPDDHGTIELNLSVLTSLGAALIGIRVGDCMLFLCADGTLHQVTPLGCKTV